MSRVEGSCICKKCGCTVHYAAYDYDKEGNEVRLPKTKVGSEDIGTRTGWVDSITGVCRACEIQQGDRWGHNTARAEEATPGAGERII